MKKLILSSLFVFITAITNVKANASLLKVDDGIENISTDALRHFGYSFYRATNISWTVTKTYQKATFTLNGKTTYALYDLSSKFLVATQITEFSELPQAIKQSLVKDFPNYKVANILKVVERPSDYQYEDDTNAYWLDLSNGTEQVVAISLFNNLTVVKSSKIQ